MTSGPLRALKSGTQMTSNGRSEMTPVPWILVIAFTLHHPCHAISLPPASSQLQGCVDNGCSEQFYGLGGCVNLAAPLKISQLSERFDLGATSLKGLCGTVGCCHCMRLLHNSTEPPIAGKSKPIAGKSKPIAGKPKPIAGKSKPTAGKSKPTAKKPSAKKPGAKRPTKPKPKKPKPKSTKSKKLKSKKPKSKKPNSKKPKSKKPKSKKPKPKKPQQAKETKASQRNQS